MLFMAPYILQMLSGLGGKTRPMFNVTISNVPGPTEPLYFNGARMEQMYPVSLLSHGQALNITVVSYAGQFNVGFTGCRDTLPHMQRMSVYMGEALDELEKALSPKKHRSAYAAVTGLYSNRLFARTSTCLLQPREVRADRLDRRDGTLFVVRRFHAFR